MTPREVFVTPPQARLNGAFLLDAATWLGTGKAKKYIVNPGTPTQAPMEVIMTTTVLTVGPGAEIGVGD